MNTIEEIQKLKKEKNAVILAHYYVDGEVQALADYVGDSYYLSKLATTLSEDVIIFCGVNFMGESAKLLNPAKTVIMADEYADCPMAHMVDIETIEKVRMENPDKKFYSVGHRQFCPNMKRISVDKVLSALQTLTPQVTLEDAIATDAKKPLEQMLKYAAL